MKNVKRLVLRSLFHSITGIAEPSQYRPVADVERDFQEVRARLELAQPTVEQVKQTLLFFARKMERATLPPLDFATLRQLRRIQDETETELARYLSPAQVHRYRHWRQARILNSCHPGLHTPSLPMTN